MKLSIERSALLRAVAQAQSVVERRNTIPILANVLIEAEGDTVSFRATDLDIEVVDKAAAKVDRAGSTTVSAVTFHEIVRKLPDGALVVLTDDPASGRMTVEAGRSHFSLATLPKEDFPVMASTEYAANFSAPAPVLRRLFDKSKFASSTEETRYYLRGRELELTGMPLRRELTEAAGVAAPAVDGTFRILVMGGSRGAHRLNELVAPAICRCRELGLPVAQNDEIGPRVDGREQGP